MIVSLRMQFDWNRNIFLWGMLIYLLQFFSVEFRI